MSKLFTPIQLGGITLPTPKTPKPHNIQFKLN